MIICSCSRSGTMPLGETILADPGGGRHEGEPEDPELVQGITDFHRRGAIGMIVVAQVDAVFEDGFQVGHEVKPATAAVHVAEDFVLDSALL